MIQLSQQEAVLLLKSMWITSLLLVNCFSHMTPELYMMFLNLAICYDCNIFHTPPMTYYVSEIIIALDSNIFGQVLHFCYKMLKRQH
jgi:hypothetical protein